MKNSIFFLKIDEIWRILANFKFLKNITLCGLNRLQFWLEHFFCNSPKNSLKSAKFWQFFKKRKNRIFYCKNGSFMVCIKFKKMSKKLENFSHFGHNTKNIPSLEFLVFFGPVGPQDAMFGKYRFFQTFSSFSKVRAKKSTIKLLMTGQ